MKRKNFLLKTAMGVASLFAIPTKTEASDAWIKGDQDVDPCEKAPRETAGPFRIKSPSELVRSNIVVDRKGIALVTALTVRDSRNHCRPMEGVLVDIWYCDKDGNYSEYQDHRQDSFLRGRQSTDSYGRVEFVGIYPGWYRGRAPHIHVEVLDKNERSLWITQIAFPEAISNEVYASTGYRGPSKTTNKGDGVFRNSLEANMAEELSGNIHDGYVVKKTIVV